MALSPEEFLFSHNLLSSSVDIEDLVRVFTEDMKLGLEGRPGSLRMIPTFIEADNDFLRGTRVLAIDAGGTNFRAALVTVSKSGEMEISGTVNRRMPGLDGEISSKEFFSAIAGYVKPLADKVERIGFCFSYPTEILPDRDGRLLQFCKEVQAREVEGQLIGRNFLETLGTPDKKIVLLNDTVATLLAGKSASPDRSFDSYIGFILGTGTNTCYIEKNSNILKSKQSEPEKTQIINIESGDFGKPPRTELDILFDATTTNPGSYRLEKMFSGGYFGSLTLFILKRAVREGLFSGNASKALSEIKELETTQVNDYISGQATRGNLLFDAITDKTDTASCKSVIECLVDRAAKLVAGNLSAVILKTGKGLHPDKPFLVTIEGTTFYKLHNFRKNFEKYFHNYLSGARKRHVEFASVDNSSLKGAALAALIE
jgi:hexokinase